MRREAEFGAPAAPGRLVVVSNRLPFSFRSAGDAWRADPSSGGLVSALYPVLHARGGLWIGWDGTEGGAPAEAFRRAAPRGGCELVPVALSADEVRDFYRGFSNEIVWPLFHDLVSLCNFRPEYWAAYRAVNRKFARVAEACIEEGDFLWVHDYHLMNLAEELSRGGAAFRAAFFLHVPFPPPEVFLKLPWRLEVLRGLLAYELVGFQTARDQRNFIACLRALGLPQGATRTGHFPIGIDYDAFHRRAGAPEVHERVREFHRLLPKRRLVLGVDRLDYTKGIPHRLRAFQRLLEREPELQGRISLMQVVVPSREELPRYGELKAEIEQLVSRINGAHARPGGWIPVWYEYRTLDRVDLLAYYRAAHIALVTPLKDGMNLVAKEFCACSLEEDCALVLSEFAGAAAQLSHGALLVNPYDEEGVADALSRAFHMSSEERSARMRALRSAVRGRDVTWWLESFLEAAANAAAGVQPRSYSRPEGAPFVDAELQVPF